MDSSLSPAGARTYKFIVKTAAEAAAVIRDRLGPDARVLSVRTVEASGVSRFWSAPRIEVIAQVPAFAEASAGGAREPQVSPPAAAEAAPAPSAEASEARLGREGARRLRPARPAHSLSSLLRRSGLSEVALARLQMAPFWQDLATAPLHRALVEAGRRLQAEADARGGKLPLSRAAFIGSPGCGRTTALCKWLGSEVFRRRRSGHVVTVEFDRPNPPGAPPRRCFCEALGVPVFRFPAAPLHPVTPGGFVAFDLPSLSLSRPEANAPLAEFLDREGIEQRVLVINAAYDHAALRATYAAGRALGATHLIFTHLDEVAQWGGLWDYLFDRALQPLFLANGPSLTGDCEEDVFGALIRRTLASGQAPSREESAVAEPMQLYRFNPMKFIFLLGGTCVPRPSPAPPAFWVGHALDRVSSLDGSVGCLAGGPPFPQLLERRPQRHPRSPSHLAAPKPRPPRFPAAPAIPPRPSPNPLIPQP